MCYCEISFPRRHYSAICHNVIVYESIKLILHSERVSPMAYVVIAMGANLSGCWGTPDHTINRAVKELVAAGLTNIKCSQFYSTSPVGGGLQSHYHNIVLTAVTSLLPNSLLPLLKSIERKAGRKLGMHWGARVLDIDIIDYNRWRLGWPAHELRRSGCNRGRRPRGSLILPHPQMHLRSFVLYPLRDIAPHWVHPAFQRPLSQLIVGLSARPVVLKMPSGPELFREFPDR